MKNKILLLALILLLTSCTGSSYPAADLSNIDNELEKNKKLNNPAITYDVTKDPNKEVADVRKKDPENVYIDKNVNFKKDENAPANLQAESASQKELTTVNELLIVDNYLGDGDEAVNGKKVTVHYVGKLTNGVTFDSSLARNEPFTFTLGGGQVIKGWDQGVVGMKVGGQRRLTIPAELAYGNKGAGTIPPGATLIFDIDLISVE